MTGLSTIFALANQYYEAQPEYRSVPAIHQVHGLDLHKSFLQRYEDSANMNDMFKNGTYQCVSASVLYSYILESLSIPYQIKELSQHVFVIAYPESFNIMIETTDPTRGQPNAVEVRGQTK